MSREAERAPTPADGPAGPPASIAAAGRGGGWRPGSRVGRLRNSHSYVSVLGMVITLFLFTVAAPDAAWSRTVLLVLLCATLLLALWTSGLGVGFRPALILVAAGLAIACAELAAGGDALRGAQWAAGAALVAAVAAAIGLGVLDNREVSGQSVVGAVCVYLLIGMMFTLLYGAIAAFTSGPLFAQGTDGTAALRLYFSFVTLATLGYGDYTPAGDLGRTVAVAEALLGQLYLVTVVAVLVAHMGARLRPPA